MTDFELIAGLKRGDPAALEAAMDRYGGYVMAVVQHTLGASAAEEDKEELVSDAFVTLWRKANALAPDSRLKTWLAVVARNAALNRLRALRPGEELQEDLMATDGAEVSAPVERREQAELLRQAVDGLPVEDKALFLRHYYGHQSIPDIAQQTGMNASTIKSRLHRGRRALKDSLLQKGYTQ